ncbi:Hypothetical protein POVR1_LOCUS322 [uncultured virus]|nr:Hypothetical protein POVR1_LOCUS322 [uncultured virus]
MDKEFVCDLMVEIFIHRGDVNILVAFYRSTRRIKDYIDRNINITANQLGCYGTKSFREVVTFYDKAIIDGMVNSHRTSVPMKDPIDNSIVHVMWERNFVDAVFGYAFSTSNVEVIKRALLKVLDSAKWAKMFITFLVNQA